MKCAFKNRFQGIFLLALALGTCAAPSVHADPSKGIFYQPWQEDLSLTASAWNLRLKRLHEDGLNTLYLQWIRYGETDFLEERLRSGELFLQVILDSAARSGIKVHVGLFSDPEFFRKLKLSSEELENYLLRLRERSLLTARQFHARYGKHPAFAGWYLPEEIDDLHWQSPAREKILMTHIHKTNHDLSALDENKPVALSSFFSGALLPEGYAAFCGKVLGDPPVDLLIQDGLGTGRMDLPATQQYHDALNRVLGENERLCWVVEIFEDELPGPAFRGKAVEPEEMEERLGIIRPSFRDRRIVFFSLRYWLDADGRLSRHYRKQRQGMRGK